MARCDLGLKFTNEGNESNAVIFSSEFDDCKSGVMLSVPAVVAMTNCRFFNEFDSRWSNVIIDDSKISGVLTANDFSTGATLSSADALGIVGNLFRQGDVTDKNEKRAFVVVGNVGQLNLEGNVFSDQDAPISKVEKVERSRTKIFTDDTIKF